VRHSRREWLVRAAGACVSAALPLRAATAPSAPVAVGRCAGYGPELVPALSALFDRIGGLGRIVKGKTVAMKVNLTGSPNYRLGYHPLGDTHYVHPNVMGAVVHLMDRAGARRIRLVESPWSTADPVEEVLLQAGMEPRHILGASPKAEFVNTNWLGKEKSYARFKVPGGGYMFPAFDLHPAYRDCDVFVSLTKMKEHKTAGITFSIKNCFGITPATIYGSGAGIDEPSILPRGGRDFMHSGARQPSKSAPSENDPSTPRDGGYRIPRIIVDLVAARPIDLAIVDGIRSMAGGEGPWNEGPLKAVSPGLLVAGTNPVTIDAVCTSLLGFDPMVDRGTPPFQDCDSTLALAEAAGLGTRDPSRIEVRTNTGPRIFADDCGYKISVYPR
jgi:uncharacterized protein (DUF362 family)